MTNDLRKLAEQKAAQLPKKAETLSPAETQRLLHELRVHQIELEMQNEELRRAQEELDAARTRYFDLYDLAPVGYVSVSESGLILETNLTAATLLGVARGALIKQPLTRFIPKEDQDIYYLHRKRLFETPSTGAGQTVTPQSCELRLVKKDGTVFWARLDGVAVQGLDGAPGCRVVLNDISEHKRADERECLARDVLELMNRSENTTDTIHDILQKIKKFTGFEAVGMRLREGDDYPYYQTSGFPDHFVEMESHLCARDGAGNVVRDAQGKPVLECMCGNILCSRTNPQFPFFTESGSFWSNCTTELLAATTEKERHARTRNRCNREGYESVALIPLRSDQEIIGLLQFNDHRRDRFTLELIHFFEGLGASIGIVLARRRAAEAAKRSEERFRSLFDNMMNGFAYCRMIYEGDQPRDFVYLLVNKAFEAQTGLKDVAGKKVSEVIPGIRETDPELIGVYGRVARTGGSERFENYVPSLNMWFEIAVYGLEKDHFVAVFDVITERKRAETALRESEAKFSMAFQTAPYAITITRAEDGAFIEVNDTFATMTGYTREEALAGSSVGLKLWAREDDRRFVMTALRAGRAVVDHEFLFRTKSGALITGLFSAQRIALAPEPCILSSINDITARKRAEQELQKMQKILGIGTLAGGIAHDFNNILLGLFGNIALAKDELARGHPGYAALEEAETSMNRAIRLTKQLLTFSKGGDPVKEDVSLGALVEDIAHFDLSGSKVKLVYQQAEDLWLAEADKGQIQQVLSNLTINARQAMPEGGRLYISLENASLPEGAIAGLRPGKYVRVTVRDEGTGIDPKHLDRIFDPYFTTKQAGNGLGLATAYSVVHKHGGHIGVVSELGKGTTFTIHLPASGAAPRAETKPAPPERPALAHPAKILVMDDEATVRTIIARMLTPCGFTVATVPDGQQAIAMYKQALDAGAPFDAVIMDLTIPGGMGGKEAIKDLLALDPGVRVIVSSGYSEDAVMAKHADYGFKGVVAKPYTKDELLEVLGQVLK